MVAKAATAGSKHTPCLVATPEFDAVSIEKAGHGCGEPKAVGATGVLFWGKAAAASDVQERRSEEFEPVGMELESMGMEFEPVVTWSSKKADGPGVGAV